MISLHCSTKILERTIFSHDIVIHFPYSHFFPYYSFASLQTPHHSIEYCLLQPQINSLEPHPQISLTVLILRHFSGIASNVDYPYSFLTLSFSNSSISDGGLVTRSCLTLCYPVDCSLPGSSLHGTCISLFPLFCIYLMV